MKGSLPTKLARIATAATRRPDHFLSYLMSQKSSPIELELPWISFAAIEFLEKHLSPNHSVFEFGSGGSTIFFGKRVKSVTSIEENKDWHALVATKLAAHNFCNVELLLSNWDSKSGPHDFMNSDYLTHLQQPVDIIMVDGQCFWPENSLREICFERAKHFLKPGGIIVLDDSWRYDPSLASSDFSRREVFQSLGPCRPGVTTTTIYWFN